MNSNGTRKIMSGKYINNSNHSSRKFGIGRWGKGAGPGSLETLWTIWQREMLGKMNGCTASSACKVEKHAKSSQKSR